ncbi:uncharacterized protein ACBT44_006105 [Syngnathus typhle]
MFTPEFHVHFALDCQLYPSSSSSHVSWEVAKLTGAADIWGVVASRRHFPFRKRPRRWYAELSCLLLGGLHRLLGRLTALTGRAGADAGTRLMSLSLRIQRSSQCARVMSSGSIS